MEEEKISVIMSAYNAESTIERAIKSVLRSTYKNIELIVVDDCSTDNTKSIIKQLMNKYTNIILVEHSINKGAGLARRSGIEHSTGALIGFVDSDDEIHESFYTTLYRYIRKYDSDIVVTTPLVVNSSIEKVKPKLLSVRIDEGEDIINKDTDKKKWLNGSLSRKDCWKDVKYSALRYIEDTPTMFRLMWYCKRLVLLDYKGYYYYQNPHSICHTITTLKSIIYRTLCVIEMLEFIEDKTKTLQRKPFLIVFKELSNILKKSSYKEIKLYSKQLFKISQFFIQKVI